MLESPEYKKSYLKCYIGITPYQLTWKTLAIKLILVLDISIIERLLVKDSAYYYPLNKLVCRLNREVLQKERLLDIIAQRD